MKPFFFPCINTFVAVTVSAGLVACAANPPQVPVRFEIRVASMDARPGWQTMLNSRTEPGTTVYVAPKVLADNSDVAEAQASEDLSGHPHVDINLTPAGTARLAQSSAALVGQYLVIMIDGEIVSMATLRSQIDTEKMSIAWPKSSEDARRIAREIPPPR